MVRMGLELITTGEKVEPITVAMISSTRRVATKTRAPGLTELAKNADFKDTLQFPNTFVGDNKVVADEAGKTKKVIGMLRDAIDSRAKNLDQTIKLTNAFLRKPEDSVEADASNVEILSTAELDAMTKDGTVNNWLNGMNDYYIGDVFTGAVVAK